MPPKRTDGGARCTHTTLITTPSPHAAEVGWRGPTARQRAAVLASLPSFSSSTLPNPSPNPKPDPKASVLAKRKRTTTTAATNPASTSPSNSDFDIWPAPPVLPDDDLALDPTHPAQSFLAWQRMKPSERNRVTPKRKTIYVVVPPRVEESVGFMGGWSRPQVGGGGAGEKKVGGKGKGEEAGEVDMEDVVAYLAAYYHGMDVKLLPSDDVAFTAWKTESKSKRSTSKPSKTKTKTPPIALTIPTNEAIRIRTRPSLDGAYEAQLNLDDLLDAAIAMLPKDAYAFLMLVSQDLYQSPEDEFVCGLAYGASRVCVVSMARYHLGLDGEMGVEREHGWPASCCRVYVEERCRAEDEDSEDEKPVRRGKKNPRQKAAPTTAPTTEAERRLRRAISAHHALEPTLTSPSDEERSAALAGLHLSRTLRTASHELAHCFGIGHCVYYACNMQGSASIREDARQAPYLCPVDLGKLGWAIGAEGGQWKGEKGGRFGVWEKERDVALGMFCREKGYVQMFAALGAWLDESAGNGEAGGGKGGDGVEEEDVREVEGKRVRLPTRLLN